MILLVEGSCSSVKKFYGRDRSFEYNQARNEKITILFIFD